MADLTIRVESNLSSVLLGLQKQAQGIDRHLPAIAEMLVGAVQDVIEAEGPGWQDLSDSTKAARRGTSYKILQDTGLLASSVSAQYGATYAEAVDGTTYGHYHVSGTKRMPRRDFTDLGPFLEPLLEDVAELLTGGF